ncbi:MAG: hypothetical protein K1X72_08935 [Pyrinomonadaceae bacterium]|nr:hypothetical protein [Pyrinomonadaceae bacterium]
MSVKSLNLSIFLLVVLAGSVLAQDRTWKTFNPPDKSWSILAPGVMVPDEAAQSPKGKEGTYAYVDYNGFFAVIYKYLGAVFSKGGHYRKQRDMVVKANNGKLLKDEEFSNGKIKGREVYVLMPDTRTISRESNLKPVNRVQRFRMFFEGGKIYILLVTLPESDIDKPEITNYFNSFSFR